MVVTKISKIVERYNNTYPDRPPLTISYGRIYGVWFLGNDYRNKSSFYGAYPQQLLKRYKVMFGHRGNILHLFSGQMKRGKYIRFDLKQKADVQGDAHILRKYFKKNKFDIIFADPPYSKDDAIKYNTKMINRYKVVKECYKILKPKGLLVWLDTMLPMYSKKLFTIVGCIGIIRSTNHRFRLVTIFKKTIL